MNASPTPPTADEVHAAANHLSQLWPGWEPTVDLAHMDITFPSCCVLAQASPTNYGLGLARLRRSGMPETLEAVFTLARSKTDEELDALNEQWRDEIKRRLDDGVTLQGR